MLVSRITLRDMLVPFAAIFLCDRPAKEYDNV